MSEEAVTAEGRPAADAPARKTRTRASSASDASGSSESAPAEAPKRKRGRPRKADAEQAKAAENAESAASADEAPKPRRGRPPKVKQDAAEQASTENRAPADDAAPRSEGESQRPQGRVRRKSVKVQHQDAARSADRPQPRPASGTQSQKQQGRQKQQGKGNRGQQPYGNQGNQGGNRKQHGRHNNQQREMVPSVNKDELAKLKVAELREKATALGLDGAGMKKAELVEAVFQAAVRAEGFKDATGVLDIMPDGYGFLRTSGYLPGEDDCFISTQFIRRFGLRKGDMVSGQTRPARPNDKYGALQKITAVNGRDPEEAAHRVRFGDLTPVYPDECLVMEHGKSAVTARVIDLVSPIGKGQRGLIVSPPKAGKTTILKDIAASITANNPEVHLMCLLVDERPEEVTDMQRSIKGEVISSTFDMPTENHIAVAELVIERAKRLVEEGRDVVILLDSITRLARAYNLAQPASGRILSGGVDSTALYPPKRFLGAARNIENGGSLTILASALVDTGSKMDEVIFEEFKGTGNMELKLDRNLADRRIFPAIDPVASGTRKEELLMDPQMATLVWGVRRILSNMNSTERSMDMLIKSLKQTETNEEFLIRTARKANRSAKGEGVAEL
ncbi:transcription termination factor Rho [Adlercreutzia aquisgranensis]|uniref:transcription termination factor Rho n=1 Tax=Adlercreutzia aquisgranensis TaxID=2941323 RepID=UPI0013647C0A|nr:transcription termination factor Rho [Adlercreutzia aquisgranensis]